MKKILFFTCEPGGAEALIPVIEKIIEDAYYEVIVVCYGYAIDRFNKKKIDFQKVNEINKNDFSIIDKYSPDYIITSATSLPQKDMSEKYLWYNAKKRNILTLAFLDQWQNYAIRFSGISKNEYMSYQPDFINCINDIGKKEMVNLGFKSKKLLELGQPYLSQLKYNFFDNKIIRKELRLNNGGKEIVLFVSEAIEEHYGNSRGYTQFETIDYLLQNKEFLKNKQVIIKLHPKDNILMFKSYKNIILIQNEYSSLEMISISDYIIGMTSIMLIEAYILNKKVLSIQLNSTNDFLLLSKEKYIKKIVRNNYKIKNNDFVHKNKLQYEFNYLLFKEVLLDEKTN